jgi:hypothetical protein
LLPDFLIIAAPRSGTTSLYNYLAQHPQLQMSSQKEPAFFHFLDSPPNFIAMANRYGEDRLQESIDRYERARRLAVLDEGSYGRLWHPDPGVRMRGEATPTYLFDPAARRQILNRLKSPKLLLLLRNPIDRAYSQYLQYLRLGIEHQYDFAAALDEEPLDVSDYWWGSRPYVRIGMYANYVQACIRDHGSSTVRVFLYEDLVERTTAMLRQIFEFLDVEPAVPIDVSERHKKAFVPAPRLSVRLLRSERRLKQAVRRVIPDALRGRLYDRIIRSHPINPPPVSSEVRTRLLSSFEADILRLQDVLDRDLSSWLGS